MLNLNPYTQPSFFSGAPSQGIPPIQPAPKKDWRSILASLSGAGPNVKNASKIEALLGSPLLHAGVGLLSSNGRNGAQMALEGAQNAMGYRGQLEERQNARSAKERLEQTAQQVAQGYGGENQVIQGLLGNPDTMKMGAQLLGNQTAYGTAPSTVREWEYFNSLQPKDQQRFLGMKRASQFLDVGPGHIPVLPGGQLGPMIPKELAPGDLPAVRRDQARETAIGSAEGAAASELDKKSVDAASSLDLIDEAEAILNSGGTTGSLFGKGRDALAGMVGLSTKGAQATASLGPIAAALTLRVPRMEGPQSDADRMLYQKAAGDVANDSLPVETRRASLATMRRLNEKYTEDRDYVTKPSGAGGWSIKKK